MKESRYDLIIVGAGILGTFHAATLLAIWEA